MIKRVVALLLACSILACGCANNTEDNKNITETDTSAVAGESVISEEMEASVEKSIPEEELGDPEEYVYEPEFDSLESDELLDYVEDSVYSELVSQLKNEEYYVENVSAVYVSKEYLEELAYNSQANIFFGYTLQDIEEVYGDKRYVFTVNDLGETIVQPFEDYDDTYERIIKNVAIGTGVILVCVTVSVVTAGAGAPAVSLIFAASAKTGTIMALSSAGLGGVAQGVITGMQTGDMNAAIKAGALEASESFKWGAISGTIMGGTSESVKYAKAMKALKGLELHISAQEAAAIQMQTGYPAEVIAQFHSMEEFKVFQDAGLKSVMVNGKSALVRSDIDLNLVDEWGRTNLQRMKLGLSPLDASGKSYELHHIGQEADATLAILKQSEHDNAALHGFKAISEIDREAFAVQRKNFWKTVARMLESGAV